MPKPASAVLAAFAASLLFSTTATLTHGRPPPATHGGQMQEAHENWVELVVSSTQVRLFVLDEARNPVPASQVSGTASMLMGGTIYKVELVSGSENSLEGQLPTAALGATAATVSLRIRGQPASARFTIGS